MVMDLIKAELATLRKSGLTAKAVEAGGWLNLVFKDFVLPIGYSKIATNLLVRLPSSYPHGKPDMFWVDEDVLLKDGRVPRSAEVIEQALGRRWRRFSWHPQTWNPAVNSLATYLEFIDRRLNQIH